MSAGRSLARTGELLGPHYPFDRTAESHWRDVATAVELFTAAPGALGGLVLRGPAGPQRDRVVKWVAARLRGRPTRRLPLHATEDRLLGGLDLPATLDAGRPVYERGLLAAVDGGVLTVPMAERLEPTTVGQLARVLDRRAVDVARDGLVASYPCCLGLLLLDEGIDEQRVAPELIDRTAFFIRLHALPPRSLPSAELDEAMAHPAPGEVKATELSPEAIRPLVEAAAAFGIDSLRAPVLAAQTARVHAALAGRHTVTADDLAVAARLVLGPRATRRPPPPEEDEPAEAPEAPPPPPDEGEGSEDERKGEVPQELFLEAVESGLVAGLLDNLGLVTTNGPRGEGGRAGVDRTALEGGRRAGVLARAPRRGERLNIVETLRAAAPWQRLRGRRDRVEVRRDDLRATRFRRRSETCVIFCVDASGSAALQRLAEAKGAVEQILIDCYSRRDHVALVAFRGIDAQLLLPPTRSLTRVRRTLASLAGGGPTPLAAGLDAAHALALDARRRGQTPLVVVMTDGRANVARNGEPGAAAAGLDARASARQLHLDRIPVLFLDTAPRPRPRARELADEMRAQYLPLPYVDASGISREVQSMAREASR